MEFGKNKVFIAVIFLLFIAATVAIALTISGGYGDGNDSNSNDAIASSSIIGNFENSITQGAVNFNSYIKVASRTWSNIIEDFDIIPITYKVDTTNGNVIAYARVNNTNNIYGGGVITLGSNISNPTGGWDNIIEHEIGHILGIGSNNKWLSAIITDNNGNRSLDRNLFPNTGDAYDELINEGKITGIVGENIPLSGSNDIIDDGGDHFSETIFDEELMTPITDTRMPLTKMTVQAIKDLGFTVNDDYVENL